MQNRKAIPDRRTVLIVDDEMDFRNQLVFHCGMLGQKVISASTGQEARTAIEGGSIDIVITDVHLPQMSGIELLDWIRGRNLEKPIVVLISGFNDIADDEAYHRGADAIVSKPFGTRELYGLIERSLAFCSPKDLRWLSPQSSPKPTSALRIELENINDPDSRSMFQLGRNGFFLGLQGSLPPLDEVIAFDITFKGGLLSRLEGTGIVRWVRERVVQGRQSGVGIELQSLSETCGESLIRLIKTLKPKPFIPCA